MISTPPKMVIQHNMARIFFFFYHAFTSIQLANHRDFFNTHSRFHSVENPLLDLDGSADRKLVYGCDGDLVAEFAKGSRQHLGTFLLFSGTHFVALLDESHSFMQDLPNYTTEPMGNGPDGGLIA